jgi:hypothetical protein
MYLFKQYCGSTVNTVSNSLTFDEMSKVKVSMTLNDFMKFASDLALTPVLLPKATIMTLFRGVIAKQTDQTFQKSGAVPFTVFLRALWYLSNTSVTKVCRKCNSSVMKV